MKHFVLLLVLISNICFAALPKPRAEYVNDFAGLIRSSDEVELTEKLKSVEYYTGIEITVVTINDFELYRDQFSTWESFATSLFNKWGVGNLPENDGVMLLVSERGRKIRIELGAGYPSRFNHIMKVIIDETIYPSFKIDAYSQGIVSGTDAIVAAVTEPVSFFEWYKWYILGGVGALLSTLIALSVDRKKNAGLFWVLLGFAGFIILGIWGLLKDGNASDGFGGGSSDGGGASGGD
ncbi:TPM domain-containing protein [Agarivorans sp. MS3-6]|uniref:TPM domain-containing protein n=1 Tax=Agarivorans sp. TSD2052 TaxID=2937286 RepID=UPI00200D1E71|nr:TPM domain-containing protein [Agarivorans sp. TSD2052]UPW18880.1 TPM domain-containing protein [Agarivorans sp. TSD2052]